MIIKLPLIVLILTSIDAFAIEKKFMDEYFHMQSGKLINVTSPCDPGCYVEIEIDRKIFSTTTSRIDWKRLYELKDEKDRSVTLNYSEEMGAYVIHVSTNTSFSLNGTLEKHPIDFALWNCYSTPQGETTVGMNSCLRGAEAAWDVELDRIYTKLGGSDNKSLKSAQLAWIQFRDTQFNWFHAAFSSKSDSKWGYGIRKRRVQVIRQQAEHLQSFYYGY